MYFIAARTMQPAPFDRFHNTGVSWLWVLKGREDEKRDNLALTDKKIIASVQRLTGEGPKTGRRICKGIDEEHRERREDKFDLRLRELKLSELQITVLDAY